MSTKIETAQKMFNAVGKQMTIKHYQSLIAGIGQPKNFDQLCLLSTYETVIQYIESDNWGTGTVKINSLSELE